MKNIFTFSSRPRQDKSALQTASIVSESGDIILLLNEKRNLSKIKMIQYDLIVEYRVKFTFENFFFK